MLFPEEVQHDFRTLCFNFSIFAPQIAMNMVPQNFTKEELVSWLGRTEQLQVLYNSAVDIRNEFVGNRLFLRGLIEISNTCTRSCLYCGIRCGNKSVSRYFLSEKEVTQCVETAAEMGMASLVIQGGERNDRDFILFIERMLKSIARKYRNRFHVTLSLGEQTTDTYRRWIDAGAHRYLLRIETTNESLYRRLHEPDTGYSFRSRLDALDTIREVGYQVGTGVMIGLPGQKIEDLAGDLLFFKEQDVDMIGMGPYISHEKTPLFPEKDGLWPPEDRMRVSLIMVALVRMMMKDVNIAATTAMQSLHEKGREMALMAGANVIMPNITPLEYRDEYFLYDNKPGSKEDIQESMPVLHQIAAATSMELALGEQGDPLHYFKRTTKG